MSIVAVLLIFAGLGMAMFPTVGHESELVNKLAALVKMEPFSAAMLFVLTGVAVLLLDIIIYFFKFHKIKIKLPIDQVEYDLSKEDDDNSEELPQTKAKEERPLSDAQLLHAESLRYLETSFTESVQSSSADKNSNPDSTELDDPDQAETDN